MKTSGFMALQWAHYQLLISYNESESTPPSIAFHGIAMG
jgi:hypothetical protein